MCLSSIDLQFDPSNCGPGLSILEDNTHLRRIAPNNRAHYTCRIATPGWSKGKHYWSIRINNRGSDGYMTLGIVNDNFDFSKDNYPGLSPGGYGYYVHNGHAFISGSGATFNSNVPRNGDIIGILLDLDERTLTYFNNGQSLGCASGQLAVLSDVIKYFPAVAFYELGHWRVGWETLAYAFGAVAASILLAKTAEQVIGEKKKGSIRQEFPGEWLGETLESIEKAAKTGDQSARKAKTLLNDKRFDTDTKN
ncbi:unnamed protein product [Rotaria sp. Silwood2]|nr:unnamed protein product [Rotaria sp. Silwood2]CAF3102739.1 unnamed protein product [Rotaria sp. Silwood2]CAF4114364.1 unnamed protein product [Rotaria sp. Silwood2]CAF4205702.1 unnamed protein product [Rotaria sp. Silwood2]CAF4429688.1 unnamed protein product [Rotaria sp. Silwood2]